MVSISPTTLCSFVWLFDRLEQSNVRVGIRYTKHWSQLMEPSVLAIAAISMFPILLLYSSALTPVI